MASDANQSPKPGRRRESSKPAAARSGERRPLQRVGDWTQARWRAPHLKRPSRKALTWTGGVLAVLALAIAILIAVWDWNWFRGPVARIASARMHREVTINGDLKVDLFSWQPSATVGGIRIANAPWAGRQDMADIGRLSVRIRLLPLLIGRVDLRLLRFDQANVALLRDANGRANWDFSGGRKAAEPLRLPPIRDFVINDGRLTYRDVQRKLSFDGTLNAAEKLGAGARGFELRGKGSLNREPFTLLVTGGPLLNIERDKPYPFDAEIRAGQTFVTAKGAVPRPFDLGRFHMDATARGPDAADLYGITGVALPNTPPYNLRGRLSRDGDTWRVDGLGGRVGTSDLAGKVAVKTGRERPLLTAQLHTKTLDFKDLGPLFGGGAGKVASPEQAAISRQLRAEQRLLPDAPLRAERIRAIDADVTYKADQIRNAPVNLRSGSAHVKLDAGVLKADPLDFELPQGRIAGTIALDARKATPVTDLDLRLSDARLEQLLPVKLGGGEPFTGAFVGRAKLRGEGDSVRKAFASADGQLMLVVPGGEIRKAFAELMGVDVVKGLGLLLSKSQETTPIRCGVANFQAQDGVFRAERIVFDTGPVLVTGSGTVDMNSERLDLKAQGQPKKFQIVRVLAPVTAEGPIVRPKLGVEAGGAIAQGGAAAALGVVLSPLAAILPFVDLGLAKDANCAGLVGDAAQQGAPVKTARR